MRATIPSIRPLAAVFQSEAVTDGDGVRIQRSVAQRSMGRFDPFLLLDEIASDDAADYIGGFPEHPHRGFETVTYMLEGRMRHRDHLGNEGLLVSGGIQWMTAGRGVLHSEMPEQESGRLHGFQLWINLPANEKMQPARYQEFGPEQLPAIRIDDHSQLKLIAGEIDLAGQHHSGPVRAVTTRPLMLDLQLGTDSNFALPVDSGRRVLLYVYQGSVRVGPDSHAQALKAQQLGELGDGEQIQIRALRDSRLLLLAAQPIGEPVVNWGPFVMNTREEIEQAIADFRDGRLVQSSDHASNATR